MPLKHNQSQILWFWRFKVRVDRFGNILNDGPNLIGFDFELDKELIAGMIPYARYRTTFHTTNNSGFGPGLEAWVGLKNSLFQMKYGKLRGAYRAAKGLIDPWIYTSMQARGSGAKYHFTQYAHIFAGYRQTDSDNDYRDENVFSAGMLYKF